MDAGQCSDSAATVYKDAVETGFHGAAQIGLHANSAHTMPATLSDLLPEHLRMIAAVLSLISIEHLVMFVDACTVIRRANRGTCYVHWPRLELDERAMTGSCYFKFTALHAFSEGDIHRFIVQAGNPCFLGLKEVRVCAPAPRDLEFLACCQLERLYIDACYDDVDLWQLGAFHAMRELSIEGPFSSEQLEHLSYCTALQTLTLTNYEEISVSYDLSFLAQLKDLEHLKISLRSFESMMPLAYCTNLKTATFCWSDKDGLQGNDGVVGGVVLSMEQMEVMKTVLD